MSNRSGSPYSAPTDADRRPVMLGVSTVDGITPVPLEVNPANGQLQVSSGGGSGGNVTITSPIGQTTKSASVSVTLASDQGTLVTSVSGTVAATQSGTWSVGVNNFPTTQAVSTASAVVNTGQQTVSTSAVQISATSTVPTNGILIGAFSTNAASIFVGSSSVTTSNGIEIPPGGIVPFTCNLNTLYIISAASTTDKIWWNVV